MRAIKNLLENPNFEEGMIRWEIVTTGPEDTPKIVSNVKYEGNYSLFVRDGAFVRSGFIPVKPGRRLRTSLYVKADNVVQGEKGWHALHFIGRTYDADKNLVYPPNLDMRIAPGTFDWKRIERTSVIPEGVAFFRIAGLGLLYTGTGKGWFDKLEVVMLSSITFESAPIDAEIFIDGITTNRFTPETIEVEEGTHDIILKKAGYEDIRETITVTSIDETIMWNLVPTWWKKHGKKVVVGVAVVGLGVGTAILIRRKRKR